ncbi:MFS transporter [Patescibacteria group bacterium]
MFKQISINQVIKYLILSDLVFWTGWGLITPIFAIFIIERIEGGSVVVVGIASAIFWISRSILRVPMGLFLDKKYGEKDDLWFVVSGFLLAGLVSFGYLIASLPWHVFVLQALYGLGMAMNVSGWCAIFTRHIDKGKEATEWGLDGTAVGLGAGIAGALGGFLVSKFGFEPVFIMVGILGIIGGLLPLFIYKKLIVSKKEKGAPFGSAEPPFPL